MRWLHLMMAGLLAITLAGCAASGTAPPEPADATETTLTALSAFPTASPIPNVSLTPTPSPVLAAPSVGEAIAAACQALDDGASWDRWVENEPDGSSFVAREHRRMARYAQDDYRRAIDVLEGPGLKDDPRIAALYVETLIWWNAAYQLEFDADWWLKQRTSQSLNVWKYSFGHLIRSIEVRPSACIDL